MKKKILFTLFIFSCGLTSFSAGYLNTKFPLPGKSIADHKTQINTIGYVFSYAARNVRGCNNFRVTDTRVTAELRNAFRKKGKLTAGMWSEEWIVDACGTTVTVPIDFEINKSRTEFHIK